MCNELIERYVPWDFCPNVTHVHLCFVGITYGQDGFCVELEEKDKNVIVNRLTVLYKNLPFAIRVTNESFRLKSLSCIKDTKSYSFYIIENSNYLNWIHAESKNIYAEDGLFHFVVMTDEEWIDIIDSSFPEVRVSCCPTAAPKRIAMHRKATA